MYFCSRKQKRKEYIMYQKEKENLLNEILNVSSKINGNVELKQGDWFKTTIQCYGSRNGEETVINTKMTITGIEHGKIAYGYLSDGEEWDTPLVYLDNKALSKLLSIIKNLLK